MSKKIIVTGGAGYIGSHTIIELLEQTDYELISIDNFSNSSPLTYTRIETITGKKVRSVDLDLCDKTALFEFLSHEGEIAGVIHFAAFKSVPESVENPYKYYHNNIASLLNMLEACLKFDIKHFIFSSSCSVYGNIDRLPVSEATALNKAACPYAYTKQIGEQILADYANVNPDFSSMALRYFNPVGAHKSGLIGEDPINKPTSLVPVITQTAVGKIPHMQVHGSDYATRDGSCIRDYIHVSDIANAHILALNYLIDQQNAENFSIVNLGSGSGVSVFEAIASFEKISGLNLNYSVGARRPGDVEAIYSDCSKSQRILNWRTNFTLDEMMESAWVWEQRLGGSRL